MSEYPLPADLMEFLSRPTPTTAMDRFFEGAAAPWHGLQFLKRRRELWRYAVLPVIANVVITGLVLLALVLIAAWFVATVHPWFQRQDSTWPQWTLIAAEIALGAVLLIVCVGAAVVVWKILSGILCGYFYGILARHVEIELGVPPEELRELPLRYQVIDTFYDLAALAAVHAVFFVVGLFPLLGAPVALAGNFSLTWFIFGADYLDLPLAMRGLRRFEKRRYCYDRLPYTLGLGTVVFVMEFIPIIGAVFLTTAAVGAVLLHRRLPENVSREPIAPQTGHP